MGEPVDPAGQVGPPLTGGPYLVKVDRYGSVSGLVQVKVPLGMLIIKSESIEDPYGVSS